MLAHRSGVSNRWADTYHGDVDSSARWARFTRLVRSAVHDLFDQSQAFGRLALVHTVFSVGTTLVTISLAGTLFFTISPEAAKGKVVLYLLLTITPFAVVAPALSPLLDRGSYARRTSMAVASVGSAVLVLMMAADIKGLLLFPEAFGVLVLSKLYLVAKAALVPSMTETDDDLASGERKACRARHSRRLCELSCGGGPPAARGTLGAAARVRRVRLRRGGCDAASEDR